MIIRVKTVKGQTLRVTVESNSRINESLFKEIFAQIIPSPKVSDYSMWLLFKDEKFCLPKGGISFSADSMINAKTISSYNLKHGEILYLKALKDESMLPEDLKEESEEKSGATISGSGEPEQKQDPVDDYLEKLDGLIPRSRDAKFCTHGEKGMCDYCMPLEPYDASYLAENKIKHMSFHSYLRSLTSRNKSMIGSEKPVPFLDEPDFSINLKCPNHPPYPKGICSKCQPSAITLKPQQFRMVDHVEFESSGIVDNFLAGWRASGYQRFGYLYGFYKPYLEVPLGIKAVVVAIYEPLQDNSVDGLELIVPDPMEPTIEAMAKELGLVRVGMIYTDLVDDGSGKGKVLHKRHEDSYFVSCLEILFMANQQLLHRNVCRYSSSGGYFGSKFVTLVASGDEEGNVAISEFQVSNTGMSLVKADLIEGCTDASMLRVAESDGTKYVPELFYMFTNEYKVNVKKTASPTFPVDYLLVSLTHGFRSEGDNPIFVPEFLGNSYPRLNRAAVGSADPNLSDLKKRLEPILGQSSNNTSSEAAHLALTDFHVLAHVFSLGLVNQEDGVSLCKAVREGKENPSLWIKFLSSKSMDLIRKSILEHAATLSASSSTSFSSSSKKAFAPWNCPHCTFTNDKDPVNCEMCGLPK